MAAAPDLFPLWSFYAVPWVLGAGTAVAARILGRRGTQALGIGLMAVPFWDTLWGILDSLGPLISGGQVLRPYSTYELSGIYEVKFLADVGELAAGFLLFASPRAADLVRQPPRALARKLAAAGLPMGRRPRSEARSAFAGLLLFPVLLAATILVSSLLTGVKELNQGDETSVFANMTPYHALLISLAAGFGEELLFRGLLMPALARTADLFERTDAQRAADPRPGAAAMAVAVGVQAVLFGFAHGGYGTWSHVITPYLFGLVAGAAAWLFGIWASIVLHVLVDLFAFGGDVAVHATWALPALSTFLLADAILALAWALRWAVRRMGRAKAPPA